MSTTVTVLDQLTIVAPFGVRFWDVAVGSPADAGLNVVAYPNAAPELRSMAFANHVGVYSFLRLPGLHGAESGSGDDSFWAANPPAIPFTIEVSDPSERYLPFRFSVKMPARGLYGVSASPLLAVAVPGDTWLPIFSSPQRTLPGPAATIYAQLQDDGPKTVAAWAMVEAHFEGMPAVFGVADDRGMVTLSAPYPEPVSTLFPSPMGTGSVKLTDQSWPVDISVFYTPRIHPQVPPDLQQTLQQTMATAWRDTNHSAAAGGFTVSYGKNLVLRSVDSVSGRSLPVLLITTAGSPV